MNTSRRKKEGVFRPVIKQGHEQSKDSVFLCSKLIMTIPPSDWPKNEPWDEYNDRVLMVFESCPPIYQVQNLKTGENREVRAIGGFCVSQNSVKAQSKKKPSGPARRPKIRKSQKSPKIKKKSQKVLRKIRKSPRRSVRKSQ